MYDGAMHELHSQQVTPTSSVELANIACEMNATDKDRLLAYLAGWCPEAMIACIKLTREERDWANERLEDQP